MYLEFFGFKEEPFNITPNSKFLFLSQRHKEALGSLLYGIEHRKGFIALTGEIGCGKTTICRAMLGKLDREKTRIALILNPELSDVELLQSINAEFGLDANSESKRVLLEILNCFLLEEFVNGRNAVLLIDEAQLLSPGALEQVRLISNLETESAKLIQIALVGQPELGDILDLPELEQLNQRITVRYHIEPLNFDELEDYINHRLSIVATDKKVRFVKKAQRKIFEYSAGVPRRINVVCDRCLLVAYTLEHLEILEEVVERAIKELGGMPKRHHQRRSVASLPVSKEFRELESAEAEHKAIIAPPPVFSTKAWPIVAGFVIGLITVALAIIFIDRVGMASPPPSNLDNVAVVITPEPEVKVVVVTPTPTATPTPTPKPTATPIPTKTPKPSPSPSISPSPSLSPSPTKSPKPTATPELSPSPSPVPTETPEPIATPAPTPSPVPSPTLEPTASPKPLLESLMAEQVVVPTMVELKPWSYDQDGVMRVKDNRFTFLASVLTWLSLDSPENRLPDQELESLRSMSADQLQDLPLTGGRPPLFLRMARIPASLDSFNPDYLPMLIQVDDEAPGFGPWSVLVAVAAGQVELYDPVGGSQKMPSELLDEHLAGMNVLFRDPEGLVGLEPLDSGASVRALQRRLATLGLYNMEPSGQYDSFTQSVVDQYREQNHMPGDLEIDPGLALRLITQSDAKVEK